VNFLIGLGMGLILPIIIVPIILSLMQMLGFYTIVREGTSQVFVLFGRVVGVVTEPGLHILWTVLGPSALIINWLGKKYTLDMRLDQRYLRSQPVNSEEGAPMGIGVWYEMKISDPISYLFKNADPQGSLAANVSNAVIRTLSNLPLDEMLEDRHSMSRAVRQEVAPKSSEWGYQLGSVYIRKVHFRDREMIHQIEAKVVNRLRQVTSAIKQTGANQVSIITSAAERQAAVEFAKAEAIRPEILGQALRQIGSDREVAEALFQILEAQNIIDSGSPITMVASRSEMLAPLLAADSPSLLPANGRRSN
jgi:regulator of protease activity HflC (stomatin/prohibitin superfamily)